MAITRVAILGDATKAMGAITEAECRRILGAIDLAESMDVPIEWFALSAGAKIAMDSGSENLDWVARVLRRLVEHTQRGGEVNVVVAGINVGAQPYWNAEATMLMHTRGILVMTPDSAMVLTGKQAIDYSGGVSAEDNLGIGGYGRIMGPNGEAQYFVPTLAAACDLLRDHYALTYRAPGERWPRRVADHRSGRPRRAVGSRTSSRAREFTTVGDIFSDTANRDRKKPFDIRTVMGAVIDADHEPLERWPEMADADMAVVYAARLGGWAVTLIGIESRPLPRHGVTPADGPAQWSAGTLFPLSSKKVARAINAASGARPVVMLANLSGFDGSPESLRRLQLEYGAEIGRALVNFDGPFVLCVISRYHGGAFVVFSSTLNDDMEVLAVEGSFASVIGGAPAAAVVFTRDVDERTSADPRVQALESAVAAASIGGRRHRASRRARGHPRPGPHREARRRRRRVRRGPQRRPRHDRSDRSTGSSPPSTSVRSSSPRSSAAWRRSMPAAGATRDDADRRRVRRPARRADASRAGGVVGRGRAPGRRSGRSGAHGRGRSRGDRGGGLAPRGVPGRPRRVVSPAAVPAGVPTRAGPQPVGPGGPLLLRRRRPRRDAQRLRRDARKPAAGGRPTSTRTRSSATSPR